MTAYIHKNWCGVGDRLVVHPAGCPRTDSPVIESAPLGEQAISAALALCGTPYEATRADLAAAGPRAMLPLRLHNNRVFHFHPETLAFIESFPNK